MTRDLTQKQFAEALAQHGFKSQGWVLGYYALPNAQHVHVSALNGGKRRRDQLAYLLRENERQSRLLGAAFAKDDHKP